VSDQVALRLRRTMWMPVIAAAGSIALAIACPDADAARSFRPVADVHVSKGTSVGGSRVLRVGHGRQVAYLRFAPGATTAPLAKATLRLYKRSAAPARLSVRVVRGSWTERLLERGRPKLSGKVASRKLRRGRGWVALDVTRAVRRAGVVDLSLSSASRRPVLIASREAGGLAPRLVLRTRSAADDGAGSGASQSGGDAGGGGNGAGGNGGGDAGGGGNGAGGNSGGSDGPVSNALRPYDVASPWNTPIGSSPGIDINSAGFMNEISKLGLPLSSDPDQYAIPVYEFNATTPRQTVKLSGYFSSYDAGDNSRKGYGFAPTITGVPIPENALQSAGSDGQIVIWDPVSGVEYSFWQFARDAGGNYTATNGYRYHTGSGYYGRFADGLAGRGAGTPYFAGLVRKWEIDQGRIDHALAFAYDSPSAEFRYPASKSDGGNFGGTSGTDLPEGARIQLDPTMTEADFNALGLSPAAKTIARALQSYGMYVIDHSGSSKIYLEDRMTAGWDTTINRNLVSKLPWSKFRVITAPTQP
jgi:hypothetical protein